MNKKILSILISLVLVVGTIIFIPGSYYNIRAEDKNILVGDISKIDITFTSDRFYPVGYKTISISDVQIQKAITSMINASVPAADSSKFDNMSGEAYKDSNIVLTLKDGTKKQCKFACDGLYEIGYIEINGKKYEPGYDFFRYIESFLEYRKINSNISKDVNALFKKYGWTPDFMVNTLKETLPVDFKHNAGEFPLKIYWAYNNELSKSIGLNFSKYCGKAVSIELYRLHDPLPKEFKPYNESIGVVLRNSGKIIGAYISAGRQRPFACALNKKDLMQITKKDWNSWLDGYINYNDKLEKELAKMKPEDIIKKYYQALDKHDIKTAYACLTRDMLCKYLTMNMVNEKLHNNGIDDNSNYDGSQNIKSVKLIGIKKGNSSGKVLSYSVNIDINYFKVITSESGKTILFIYMQKETEKSGWRISIIGTGP
ncbi:MAG: DUF4830 domain-containing protein [Bacteroidota bacterium]|nr:DUF4830 domain-containing protein [Bacteroidota bacterium]